MKMIRPTPIDDAALISSNVPETDYSAFSSVTTYAQGDRVLLASSHRNYESLVPSNLGNHPEVVSTSLNLAIAGNRVFTVSAGLSFAAAQEVEVYAADDPSVLLTGTVTSYTSGTLVLNITDVKGGGFHSAWIIKRPAMWLDIGTNNRWRMFDKSATSQTTNPDSIVISTSVAGRIGAVALVNIEASSVQVQVSHPSSGVIYDSTQILSLTNGIKTWYAWFFGQRSRSTFAVFDDLPPYAGATLTITISDPGNTVACGACVIGQVSELGDTLLGMELGIVDYSVKSVDDWGNATVVQRAAANVSRMTLLVDNNKADSVHATLKAFRATPAVYVGSKLFGASVIYGFFKSFSVVVAYPDHSLCDIEIEELI